MLRRRFLASIGLGLGLLAIAGCSGQEVLNDLTTSKGYSVQKDVVYDAQNNLRLDVYRPDDARNAPVVVFFYGGRWQEGSKEEYAFVGQALASEGFVAVLPDYRLYPQVRYPDFLKDCAESVRWTVDNIAGHGGDPGKIVLMGHSAGAYNAAMLALDPAFLAAVGVKRTQIRGMIGLAGPYDFLPITDPTLRVIFSPPEKFPQTQPVFWVDGTNPPMLLMHGQNDETVDVKNTIELAQRIKDANGSVDTVIYKDLSHGKIVASLSTEFRANFSHADVLDVAAEFVRRVTGEPPGQQESQ